jgi:hypothetical protein
MGMSDVQDKPPTNTYQAADWIVKRHPWAREMVERVVGPLGDVDSNHIWLNELAQAVLDHAAYSEEWKRYRDRTPPPSSYDDPDERKYNAWEAAGPQPTPGAAAYGPMSSGERRIVRLIATLARAGVPWSVDDISFDQRGARILLDWMAVCRAQLPEELYDPNYDPEAKWRDFAARREAGEL